MENEHWFKKSKTITQWVIMTKDRKQIASGKRPAMYSMQLVDEKISLAFIWNLQGRLCRSKYAKRG